MKVIFIGNHTGPHTLPHILKFGSFWTELGNPVVAPSPKIPHFCLDLLRPRFPLGGNIPKLPNLGSASNCFETRRIFDLSFLGKSSLTNRALPCWMYLEAVLAWAHLPRTTMSAIGTPSIKSRVAPPWRSEWGVKVTRLIPSFLRAFLRALRKLWALTETRLDRWLGGRFSNFLVRSSQSPPWTITLWLRPVLDFGRARIPSWPDTSRSSRFTPTASESRRYPSKQARKIHSCSNWLRRPNSLTRIVARSQGIGGRCLDGLRRAHPFKALAEPFNDHLPLSKNKRTTCLWLKIPRGQYAGLRYFCYFSIWSGELQPS